MHWTEERNKAILFAMDDQRRRAERFRTLHRGPSPLLLPNPWDSGTARLLAHLGFEALGTTSFGVATAGGRRCADRATLLENCRLLAAATDLPVTADLENGFGHRPQDAAAAIRGAWDAGAVGGSIEDATGDPGDPIYERTLAIEKVTAAVEAARALPGPFTVTARAENFLFGRRDLDDTIDRLVAFEEAGADVLYAPGLHSLAEIQAVVAAVRRPINVVMGFADPSLTLEQLASVGVGRVSIGGALARLALAAFLRGAREMRAGRFDFLREMASVPELHAAFPPSPGRG